MARGGREADTRVRGMGLLPRFVLSTTGALTIVMAIAGYTLYASSASITQNALDESFAQAAVLAAENPPRQQVGSEARTIGKTRVFDITYGEGNRKRGTLYQYWKGKRTSENSSEVIRISESNDATKSLWRIILSVMILVVLVGAGVALWAASQVTKPIHKIVDDVRQIARGDLQHRIRVRGGGEVELLARSIDRMTSELEEAREAELELSIRNREMELATGVRESLLPVTTPMVPGYDLGAAQLGSEHIGGDLHDYIEYGDGRIGLLVCEVSGLGIPAALIGATARSYLRGELRQDQSVDEALKRVNRDLAQDVRRGMYVTALFVLVDPAQHKATVASAGHKLPLLRFTGADKKLRVVHPEGIALGFDKGPVFERALKVQEIELAPGDRLTLANTGPVVVANEEGEELGEKAFYSHVMRGSALPTTKFLKSVRKGLEDYAGEEPFPRDISIVTITREA